MLEKDLMIAKEAAQNFLDDIYLGVKWDLVEATTEDVKRLKEFGVVVPSKDIAVFRGTYMLADKANRNKHYLSFKTIEKAIKTLIGKPVNLFHNRAFPKGFYFDAKLDKESKEMVVSGIFWKSIFGKAYEEVKKWFEEGTAGQSFELRFSKHFKRDEDGSIEFEDIEFAGGALLPRDKAAEPDTNLLQFAEEEVEELVYATQVTIGSFNCECIKCGYTKKSEQHCKDLKCPKCGGQMRRKERPGPGQVKGGEITVEFWNILTAESISDEEFEQAYLALHNWEEEPIEEASKLDYQQRKNLSDSDFAYVKTVENKVTGKPRKIRRFPINDEAHVRNALARLPQAKGLTPAEKAEIKRKILSRARKLGMKELLERHKEETVAMRLELVEQLLYDAVCPKCGHSYGMKTLDINMEKQVAQLECTSCGKKFKVKFGLQKAEVLTEGGKEVENYTKEQVDQMLAKQKSELEAEFKKQLEEALAKAKEGLFTEEQVKEKINTAVKEAKDKDTKVEARIKEIEDISPFASDEAKAKAKEEVLDDDRFAELKKDAKIRKLEADSKVKDDALAKAGITIPTGGPTPAKKDGDKADEISEI